MLIDPTQTVSIARAAEITQVSRRTIYSWLASGKLKFIRTAGGSIRIYTDSLWREPGTDGRRPPGPPDPPQGPQE